MPPTTSSRRRAALENYLRDNERPVYLVTDDSELPNPRGASDIYFGFYQQRDASTEQSAVKLRFDPNVSEFFNWLVSQPKPRDRWNRHLHGILLQQYGGFLGYTMLANDPVLNATAADMMQAIQNEYYGLVDMAEVLIEHGHTADHLTTARRLLSQAEPLADHTLSKDMRGRHHYRLGFLAYREMEQAQAQGDHDRARNRAVEARQEFTRSVAAYPHPDNPSHAGLAIFKPAE